MEGEKFIRKDGPGEVKNQAFTSLMVIPRGNKDLKRLKLPLKI